MTFSFFVALYFALDGIEYPVTEKDEKKNSISMWCFNRMWIEERYKQFCLIVSARHKKNLMNSEKT